MSSAAAGVPHPVRVAVVGPTATGKSDLALALAEQAQAGGLSEGAEIINADASLLYRGMDIGTAKPSPVERVRVPHHQIDVLSVRDQASVAAFQRAARSDIEGVESRGNLVIIAGGSGLYVRALTDGLDFPGTDPQVRTRLAERAEREGTSVLYTELTGLDPVAAERIEASNTRRIVRALEVIEITGRPFSASLPRYEDVAPTVHIALGCERRLLDLRINARARAMFERGLVEEVETLIDQGIREGETAPRAIGYAQALAVIDGTMSVPEAVDSTALATRQLASRQIKWFRRDPRVRWIDVELTEDGRCSDAERSRVTRQARELVLAVDGVA